MRRGAFCVALVLFGCSRKKPPPPEPVDAGNPKSCDIRDLPKILWPLPGEVSRDYNIVAYTDDDPSPGLRDYKGHTGDEAITYNGHDGIDIGIDGFAAMDKGVPVFVGLDGVVKSAEDGAPDRNTAETPAVEKKKANDVVVLAPNGFTVAYWHLKKGSVLVKAGDRVRAGQQIGEVGSSGLSTGPHLHISTYNCAGTALEMMGEGLFASAPSYDPPPILTSIQLSFSSDSPSPSLVATSSASGQTVYVYYTFGSVAKGDRVSLTATPQTGAPFTLSAGNDGPHRLGSFFWHPNFALATLGTWTLTTKINDTMVDQRTWLVTPRP
jgi:murein DD-endopeptidase MepM/ murein hydrolase activator NlpD